MPSKRKTQRSRAIPQRSEHDDTEAVTAFLRALEHPLKTVVEDIRAAILAADRSITEGIKWNTVSFYCYGWFATINVRAKAGLQIVLHHGAKLRDDSRLSETIDDPSRLLAWLSADRAIIAIINAEDFQRKQAPLKNVIKQWAEYQAEAKP